MRKKNENHDVKMAAAARLAAEGKDQRTIGRRLKISQSGVSRLLKEAEEDRGWLVRTLHVIQSKIPEEVRLQADKLLAPHELERRLRDAWRSTRLREIHVFDCCPDGATASDIDACLPLFGRAAATRVRELIKPLHVIGVAWGATLANIVRGLEQVCEAGARQNNPVEFVPLCCEPLGFAQVAGSASLLAGQLNQIINQGRGKVHSFTGVPAFIPTDFSPQDRATVERLLRQVESYAHIFPPRHTSPNDAPPGGYLVQQVQLVLTSVGPPEKALGFINDGLVHNLRIERSELQKHVVGDICGVLIPQPGLDADSLRRVEEWNQAWTGITLDQLRAIPSRVGDHPAGRVLVSIGINKVPIVLEAVRLDLVDELLIDSSLAAGLASALGV